MPLTHSLQGAPAWLTQYIENLVNTSRRHGTEPYLPFRKLSKEQNEAIKEQINRLVESQQGNRFDIIPFSVTGTSSPIRINPEDLRHIIEDEGFARKVYESTTGYHNISRGELDDLRKRARETFEANLPEIRKLEQERGPLESERERLESERERLEPDIARLREERSSLEPNIKRLEEERKKLISEESRVNTEKQKLKNLPQVFSGFEAINVPNPRIAAEMPKLDAQLGELSSARSKLDAQLGELSSARSKLDAQLGELSSARSNLFSRLKELRPEVPEDLVRRSSIEREINKLRSSQGNQIAPMNELHERAINMLERGFNDDTMQLAVDELKSAKRHDELKAVEPLVKSSLEGPTDEYMNKYINDYTKDIRKALEDESEEEFIKKIAPKINMSFSQMGAFHSGARNKALENALSQHRVKLHREIAHLTAGARDKAMEHHELQKRREQSAAHLMGHTTKSEKEAARHQAELLRQHGVTKHSLNHLDVAALGQVARAKQEQAQHEIDVERQEHERERIFPHEQLAREAALVSGLPMPQSQMVSGQLAQAPTPPNLFNVAGGTLAHLAAGFGQPQQQQRQFKEGGSVRKKYAGGGAIGSDDIGNEIRNIIKEQEQNNRSHLAQVSQHNPWQDWLRHVGKEMLANPHANPLLNVGRGTSSAMDHRDMMKERAANLYDKIQATKLNQYQVLAAYENMKDKSSLEREKLKETMRGHNLMYAASLAKNNNATTERKKSSTEKKLEDKALENIIENYEMKNDLKLMEDAISKSTLGTGPWIGPAKSFLGVGNDIDVLGNHIVTKANKLYGRGAGSNLQLKTLQGGKPGQNLTKKANETIIKKYGQESERRINKNIAYLLKSGWTMEDILAATGIENPENMELNEPKHEKSPDMSPPPQEQGESWGLLFGGRPG